MIEEASDVIDACFGITSQDTCLVLDGAVTGSICLLASVSDGDFDVIPWTGGVGDLLASLTTTEKAKQFLEIPFARETFDCGGGGPPAAHEWTEKFGNTVREPLGHDMAVGVHLQNEVLYLNSVKAVDKAFRLGLYYGINASHFCYNALKESFNAPTLHAPGLSQF
ncbi:hypothetical protein BJV77DRAFT_965925 [Russula vinacea]|nr:hypothetical protein BJV77DRAFT_965925 [Russula vinacea]